MHISFTIPQHRRAIPNAKLPPSGSTVESTPELITSTAPEEAAPPRQLRRRKKSPSSRNAKVDRQLDPSIGRKIQSLQRTLKEEEEEEEEVVVEVEEAAVVVTAVTTATTTTKQRFSPSLANNFLLQDRDRRKNSLKEPESEFLRKETIRKQGEEEEAQEVGVLQQQQQFPLQQQHQQQQCRQRKDS